MSFLDVESRHTVGHVFWLSYVVWLNKSNFHRAVWLNNKGSKRNAHDTSCDHYKLQNKLKFNFNKSIKHKFYIRWWSLWWNCGEPTVFGCNLFWKKLWLCFMLLIGPALFCHIFWEANACADLLAGLGHSGGFHWTGPSSPTQPCVGSGCESMCLD